MRIAKPSSQYTALVSISICAFASTMIYSTFGSVSAAALRVAKPSKRKEVAPVRNSIVASLTVDTV
jgi:hypothetical protein